MAATAKVPLRPTFASLLSPFGVAAPPVPLTGLQADSRRIESGNLFLACAGIGHHGLAYLDQAEAAGAAAIAWEPADGVTAPVTRLPAVAVPDLSRLAGCMASRWYGNPSEQLFTVGITGTDGKTSIAYLLSQALDAVGIACGYVGTLGSGRVGSLADAQLTTPAPVDLQATLADLVAGGAKAAALEVSSIGLHQSRVAGVSFDAAVLSNIGRDHLDYHGDLAAYVAAKRTLFDAPGLRTRIMNRDDAYGRAWAHECAASNGCIVYGIGGQASLPGRYVLAKGHESGPRGLRIDIDSSWGRGQLQSRLLGSFNVHNLLAVLAVLLAREVRLGDALDALGSLRTVPGRMEAFRRADGALLVVDYAHTPQALSAVLSAARAHASRRLIVVFGCGGDRDRGKRALMGQAAAAADLAIVTSDNPRSEPPEAIIAEVMQGVPSATPSEAIGDRRAAIERAASLASNGDVVVIAGKGHEDYQLIGDRCLPFSDRALASQLAGTDA